MASKGADLATRFEAANADFIQKIEGLSPEQWSKPCAETGWTAGVTAHHVAEDHAVLAQLIGGVASGASMPPITAQALDAMNAEHAQRAANVTRDETLQLARTNGAQAAQMLRGLSDEQLQNTITFATPAGDQTMTAAAVAQNVLIGHIGMHLPMIESAVS
ncbi:MAG: DinB family protein [Dehalococcoidia bacterium]